MLIHATLAFCHSSVYTGRPCWMNSRQNFLISSAWIYSRICNVTSSSSKGNDVRAEHLLRKEAMKPHWEPITLELKITFRVAHGASDQRHNVLVYLDDGVGEAAAVPYYGETQNGIIEYLKSVPDLGDDLLDLDAVLAKRPAGSRAARSAIDEALHDLWGKKLGQPLYKLFGLNPKELPLTSFTIGMDEPEVMADQAKESAYPILKIKLGSEK